MWLLFGRVPYCDATVLYNSNCNIFVNEKTLPRQLNPGNANTSW